jgi:hypothetical protein
LVPSLAALSSTDVTRDVHQVQLRRLLATREASVDDAQGFVMSVGVVEAAHHDALADVTVGRSVAGDRTPETEQ